MEVLEGQIKKREGNDCLITEAIALIKISYDIYIVTYTESVFGGWTGNPITTKSDTYRDYDSANKEYESLKKKLDK